MRKMREQEPHTNNVVEIGKFRHRLKEGESDVSGLEPTSSIHIDILRNGSVKAIPMMIHRSQALVLLELALAASIHVLDVYKGH